jgi:hypothetical protein
MDDVWFVTNLKQLSILCGTARLLELFGYGLWLSTVFSLLPLFIRKGFFLGTNG